MDKKLRQLALVGLLFGPLTANAGLIGTSVTGAMYWWYPSVGQPNTTTNYFDPANGYVPASGYGNSTGTTATISDPGIEFIAENSLPSSITADFADSTLTITKSIPFLTGIGGEEFVFTDAAFVGLSLAKLSDSFDNGGMTAELVGDTLTLGFGPNCIAPGPGCTWTSEVESAQFSLVAPVSSVPEPATLSLFGLGLVGVALTRRLGKV